MSESCHALAPWMLAPKSLIKGTPRSPKLEHLPEKGVPFGLVFA